MSANGLFFSSAHGAKDLGNFTLHRNLHHVNPIEWVASAMECSVIGAKNVANLAYNQWKGKDIRNKSHVVNETETRTNEEL